MVINNNGTFSITIGDNDIVIYPNEYNGPGISTPLFVQSIVNDYATNISYLNVPGDMTYRFVQDFPFTISASASGENDGNYITLTNSMYSSGNNTTSVPVSGFVPNVAPAGYITYQVIGQYQSTSLSLPGLGVLNYGPYIVDDLTNLLSNFSSSSSPISPSIGQLWYNSSAQTLNVYTGSSWISTTTTAPSAVPLGNIQTLSLPASGTPYTYDNNNSNNVEIVINGSITSLVYTRSNNSVDLSTFTTNITLSPADSITMTYDITPYVYVIPR
jgi:hypothetical protein